MVRLRHGKRLRAPAPILCWFDASFNTKPACSGFLLFWLVYPEAKPAFIRLPFLSGVSMSAPASARIFVLADGVSAGIPIFRHTNLKPAQLLSYKPNAILLPMQTKSTDILSFIAAASFRSNALSRNGTHRREAATVAALYYETAHTLPEHGPIAAGMKLRYNARTLHPTNQCSGSFLNLQIVSIPYSSASIGAALVSVRPSQEHNFVKYRYPVLQ